MKNLRELKSDELVSISGGELPYTGNFDWKRMHEDFHTIGDFCRGLWDGFTRKK
jgi:hypothetical protein